ncbi:MAG: cbb3-type cytochrome oxidase assembly protein CcoS [Propionivibrio sp.]|jgi:cbb3-type cytochrome oxidase maturation protein|uniref:cbb3-type cytochrome oxidase assembly protein CcoS n=1 Tax=Propionivibrio sp. TaxID=2212460 RepID=UPI001B3D19A8|nr:cbb3-type cytochrome oxidase assembly protein CcoS [Propionivibrio sp.]MBP7202559.1 cbb3-type cytochrome oxidase assembly protein CcoS [Propionivibrio sp.]
MESLYLLIPVSVVLVFLIGLVFWWSLRNGQFDDLEGPAYRVLMDNDKAPEDDGEATKPPGPKAGDGSV